MKYEKLEKFVATAKTQNDTINTIAAQLSELMQDCAISTISAGGVSLRLRKVRASCASSLELELCVINEYSEFWVALEYSPDSENSTHYLWGDFNAAISRPSRDNLLQFAKAVPSILQKIESSIVDAELAIDQAKIPELKKAG